MSDYKPGRNTALISFNLDSPRFERELVKVIGLLPQVGFDAVVLKIKEGGNYKDSVIRLAVGIAKGMGLRVGVGYNVFGREKDRYVHDHVYSVPLYQHALEESFRACQMYGADFTCIDAEMYPWDAATKQAFDPSKIWKVCVTATRASQITADVGLGCTSGDKNSPYWGSHPLTRHHVTQTSDRTMLVGDGAMNHGAGIPEGWNIPDNDKSPQFQLWWMCWVSDRPEAAYHRSLWSVREIRRQLDRVNKMLPMMVGWPMSMVERVCVEAIENRWRL